ncbi:MAG: hypothetical protein ACRD30_01175 [Bryobacteraceae bacterium]
MKTPLFLLCALASVAANAQSIGPVYEPQGGPTELIITYRCPPPRRAGFRQYMTEAGIQRFDGWKRDGVLKDYKLLFNWYVDVDTWDAMAVLSFPSYAEAARWNEIERINPGGLTRDALDIAWPLNTYSTDLVWQGSDTANPAQDPSRSVYFVVPYDSGGDFRDYADSYFIPQAKGWMKEGILASYRIYKNRYPGGKRWQALAILEYKDIDAFGRRDQVAAKVKAELQGDPAWKASNARQKTNLEREPVMASALLAH